MASRSAAAARLGLNEIQGQVPFAEGDGIRNQFWIFARMNHVADLAPFAAVLPVDMNVMQILIAVPKTRGIGSRRELEQVAVMAAEAKLEFILVVGDIEVGCVWLDQELIIRCAVGIVAPCAFPVPDGAMKDGFVLLDEALMTIEAKVLAGFRQELW